uniref:Uncharacterized protein n=1 Tax=Nelumbo nucifera TaxID=4432 RepID=A0A822ZPX5_NELNU|nr:TPA_asm: hypothetical protein HUJ06_003811 [Nelumbo nucifera]
MNNIPFQPKRNISPTQAPTSNSLTPALHLRL